MTLISPIAPIYSKVVCMLNPSLSLAMAIILLLLSNLPAVHASNNLDNTNQKKLEFRDTINLTNNERDSVYGQISTSNNNVYVVWQESKPGSDLRNYEIRFKRSIDNGSSFSQEINLSNNTGFSEHPQVSSAADNVHVIWADDTNGNKQVYFKTSSDNGNTFGEAIKLSSDSSSSFNQDIAAFGNNVYAVWLEKAFSGPYRVMLATSEDGGNSFSDPVSLSESASTQSYPKISAFNGHVYVTWNVEDHPNASTGINEGVFFISSSDNGSTFGNVSKLNTEENGFGKPQVAAGFDNTVYVIWGGSSKNQVRSIYLVKSDDNGRNFGDIKKIEETEQGKINNPLNVEIVVDEINRLFIAWQDRVGTASVEKEDILSAISLDGGERFESTTNISNNADTSECPSIAVNGDNLYITWEDLTPGNHEVLYRHGLLSF
ncbi:MAG: hypothetical protein GEU26_03215 [Nitrososphaeraceae archaeon]|nr:hypothetical protein [Nitrososphaeraceae archaeon]